MNPCKDILTNSGFNSLDADDVLDKIRNSNKSLDELTEDIIFKQEKANFHPENQERSFTIGTSYLDAMASVSSTLKKPYRTIMRYFGSDQNGLAQRAQSRWISLLSRYTAETGVSTRDFFKMINGSIWTDTHEPFRKAFVREMGHDGENIVSGNELANKLANSVKRNWRLDIEEANLYGAGIKFKKLWMTNQYHNSELLAEHGADNWARDILKAIDEDATINNIKHFHPELAKLSDDKFDLDDFLFRTYESISNGRTSGSGILAEQFKLHRIFEF